MHSKKNDTTASHSPAKSSPVGIFDSGIGGLTVLKEIAERLPAEDTVYLGDTARVPYGSKSRETVERYAVEVARFLTRHSVKMLVVACNTASAYAIDRLKREFSIPVIGVIEPGANAAVQATTSNTVGVIGTEGTIKSSAYCKAIKALNPAVTTRTRACPLFVPLVEEGWSDDEVTRLVAERYLGEFKDNGIDTLVLGCTHYPLLKHTLSAVMGPTVRLIDSAEATAAEVERMLAEMGLLNDEPGHEASRRFYATDSPERFVKVGRLFFGPGLDTAEPADLEMR